MKQVNISSQTQFCENSHLTFVPSLGCIEDVGDVLSPENTELRTTLRRLGSAYLRKGMVAADARSPRNTPGTISSQSTPQPLPSTAQNSRRSPGSGFTRQQRLRSCDSVLALSCSELG